MPGVEILNSEVVYVIDFSAVPLIICFIVGIIVGLLIAYSDAEDALGYALHGIAGAVIGLLIGFLLVLGTVHSTDEVDYVKHDVIISDEVNFNEFTEHYEILEQKGKIYTVREKTK